MRLSDHRCAILLEVPELRFRALDGCQPERIERMSEEIIKKNAELGKLLTGEAQKQYEDSRREALVADADRA